MKAQSSSLHYINNCRYKTHLSQPVRGLVPLQVGLLPEGLVAQLALERPHVLVHAHVHHQVVRLAERLAADLAVLELPRARLVVAHGGLRSVGRSV